MTPQNSETLVREDLHEFSNFLEESEPTPEKKKRGLVKFFVYLGVILVLTAVALFVSLKDNYKAVFNTLERVRVPYLLLMMAIILFSYVLDGFAIFLFSRLYTHKYKIHQGIATSYIGAFYTNVSPGKSAGQVMEVYTMKKQGVATSNAASIMVMSFIVYEISIILIATVGLFLSQIVLSNVGELNIFGLRITSIPLLIIGFALHILIIVGLFTMSYSQFFHNLILNHGINFLAKIRIIKKPEEKRESLRIQVENFKIELRRLTSNIPIFLTMIILFSSILMLRFSIPYFAGLALDGFGFRVNADGSLVVQIIDGGVAVVQTVGTESFSSCMQGIFLSSFTQLLTSVIPIPGGAGISEYFFTTFFFNYYNSASMVVAAQILWRFTSFMFLLVVAGLVTALYRSSPKDEFHHASRKNYVTLQYLTFDERQVDPTLKGQQFISVKKIAENLRQMRKPKSRTKYEDLSEFTSKLPTNSSLSNNLDTQYKHAKDSKKR